LRREESIVARTAGNVKMARPALPTLIVRHPAVSVFAVQRRLASFSSLLAPLLLIALCAALYLPGTWSVPVLDRDEARFAVATRQMVASGDLLRPRFLNTDRLNKPIGIYWLQSISLAAFHPRSANAIWPYRLPSIIAAAVAVLMTFRLGQMLFDDRVAWLAAILLAASVLLVVEAHQATTDAALLASTAGAMLCLASIYKRANDGLESSRLHAAGFWIWLGVGTLIKGPVLGAVLAATIGALLWADRRRAGSPDSEVGRRFRMGLHPIVGIAISVAIVAPWLIAITVIAGRGFYYQAIIVDLLPRFRGSYEVHWGPPGYYFVSSAIAFWPGSLAIIPALVIAYRRRAEPAVRFCLAWLGPAWIALEIIPTKLPHYVLPLYPALALIVAVAASDIAADWRAILRRPVGIVGIAAWIATSVGLAIAAVAVPVVFGDGFMITSLLPAVAAVAAGLGGIALARRGQMRAALLSAAGAAVIFYAPLLHWEVPALQQLWNSEKAVAALNQLPDGRDRPVAAVGYQEPSLVFLLDRPTQLVDPAAAAAFLAEHQDGAVLIDERARGSFIEAAHKRGLTLHQAWSGGGLDYTDGDRIGLALYELNGG
jgi:4-amino-4-deoxy-L-arabinose transferase-like glycosyltransferase